MSRADDSNNRDVFSELIAEAKAARGASSADKLKVWQKGEAYFADIRTQTNNYFMAHGKYPDLYAPEMLIRARQRFDLTLYGADAPEPDTPAPAVSPARPRKWSKLWAAAGIGGAIAAIAGLYAAKQARDEANLKTYPALAVAKDGFGRTYSGLARTEAEAQQFASDSCNAESLGCTAMASVPGGAAACLVSLPAQTTTAANRVAPYRGDAKDKARVDVLKSQYNAAKNGLSFMDSVRIDCNDATLAKEARDHVTGGKDGLLFALPSSLSYAGFYKGSYVPARDMLTLYNDASGQKGFKNFYTPNICVTVTDRADDKMVKATVKHNNAQSSGFIRQTDLRPAPDCASSVPAAAASDGKTRAPKLDEEFKPAVLMSPARIYAAPDASSKVLRTLEAGACIQLGDREDGTDYTRLLVKDAKSQNLTEGWINKPITKPEPRCNQ